MANHGLAWIGLISGLKLWHVRAYGMPRPANPTCDERHSIEVLPNVTHCLQRPGEVMLVPTAWWHATCNLDPFTFGVGGQDACDLLDCTPPGPPDETARELHMRKQFCRDDRVVEFCNTDAGAVEASRDRWDRRTLGRVTGHRPWALEQEEWLT